MTGEPDCTGYETRLGLLLADELAPAERADALERLGVHARGCAGCARTAGLLEWLALPPEERDIVADPAPQYWSDFNDRVRRRIDAGRSRRAPARLRWAGLAAAVVLAALAGGVALRGPAAPPSDAGSAGNGLVLPPELVELIERDPSEVGRLGLAAEPGWKGTEEDASWFYPETDDLDAASRGELLQWLRSRTPEAAGARS